ncbi:MAG TPA: ATP-binding protein, partial [Thermoanaerobaculia bacterium]|nr:ATP-binding protein [Thermoanaerobaculia bacterium]
VSVASTRTPFSDDDLELLQIVAERIGPVIARGRVVERLTAAQRRLAQLSRRLLNAQEEERRRVARELHDELGQVLTAVKINLESLQGSGTLSASDLRDAVKSVDEAVTSVHELALELRPSILDDLGLSAALRWQLDRRARQAGVVPHIQIGEIPRLPAEVETASFRVAQEALTNVLRHARAKAVWLEAGLRDGALELSVSDDGVGFDVEAARERASSGASMGLLSMEERVSLLGGSFEILSSSGRGSSVRARFPLNGGRSETAAESAR